MISPNSTVRQVDVAPQPIAPAISMRWYFGLAAIIALAITMLARSESIKLQLLVGILLGAVLTFLFVSAVLFSIALLVGAVNKILFAPAQTTQSPFASETLPPQVIPPQARD